VVGCRFHLSQAWFRRIKSDKKLNKHYAGKTVVYQWQYNFWADEPPRTINGSEAFH